MAGQKPILIAWRIFQIGTTISDVDVVQRQENPPASEMRVFDLPLFHRLPSSGAEDEGVFP